MKTQNDVVVEACVALGLVEGNQHLIKTEADRALVLIYLEEAFEKGEFKSSNPEVNADARRRHAYMGCVIATAMKQDKRLNGGVAYVPATTRGPRDGSVGVKSKDSILNTALQSRALYQQAGVANDDERIVKLNALIAKREKELAEKAAMNKEELSKKAKLAKADALLAALNLDL